MSSAVTSYSEAILLRSTLSLAMTQLPGTNKLHVYFVHIFL